ncbi:MAG: hypothetical protein SGI71_09015 [Verrucomicrobiota bacterium]|nr:hypothetical protein [Verrucomicrobiota bacterium]
MEKKQGMTLAEILISTSVFTTCMALMLSGFVAMQKMYFFTYTMNNTHDDLRTTLDKITHEIRSSPVYPIVYNAAGTPAGDGQAGTDLRVMKIAAYGHTKQSENINSKNVEMDDITVVAGNGTTQGSIVTDATTANAITGSSPIPSGAMTTLPANVFRSTPVTNTFSTGNAVRFDQIYQPAGTTNTIPLQGYVDEIKGNSGNNKLKLKLVSGLPISVTNNTLVFFGTESRYLVVNNELRYYPDSSKTNAGSYKVIASNLSTNKISFTTRDQLAEISVQTETAGTISGKQILRYQTQAAPRMDSGFVTRY